VNGFAAAVNVGYIKQVNIYLMYLLHHGQPELGNSEDQKEEQPQQYLVSSVGDGPVDVDGFVDVEVIVLPASGQVDEAVLA